MIVENHVGRHGGVLILAPVADASRSTHCAGINQHRQYHEVQQNVRFFYHYGRHVPMKPTTPTDSTGTKDVRKLRQAT